MKRKKIIMPCLLLIDLVFSSALFAETVVLKSAKKIEGKIIERTDKYIKVDFYGIPITYWLDEVESIDGIRINSTNDKLYDKYLHQEALIMTLEDIEQSFQKGLLYNKENKIDEALNEFEKVVSANSSNLPHDYYVHTYSEAHFDIGWLNYGKNKIRESIESYKKALSILPNHERALYYLVYNFITVGEISEAMHYYNKAKTFGFTGENIEAGDKVNDYLATFKNRKFTLKYQSYFKPDKSIEIMLEGNTICDNALLIDAIAGIEKLLKIDGRDIFSEASIEFIRYKEDQTIWIEKWSIVGEGWKENFWMKYDSTPPEGFPYKIMIEGSKEEII